MGILSRESAPLAAALWDKIDETVTRTAAQALAGRRFLYIAGPYGAGLASINIDDGKTLAEQSADGILTTAGRAYVELPTLFADFTLLARDLEAAARQGIAPDLSAAAEAAATLARTEDRFVFFGSETHGYKGIFTAPGTGLLERGDWKTGEAAFADVAAALTQLVQKGIYGPYALVLSPDLALALQRIQPGTGVLEIDRIKKLVGHVYTAPALGTGKAALLATDARYIDLVVGQDIAAAYLEQRALNHAFRVLETVVPRVKRPDAVVLLA